MDAKHMGGSNDPRHLPCDIRFGESQVPCLCSACNTMSRFGFWVILGTENLLICIKCTAASVVRLQELHPDENLLEADLNVDPYQLKDAADAVRTVAPELSESKALEVVKVTVDALSTV